MSVTDLARPDIVAMSPYASARSEASSDGILLNANESPWPLFEDPWADRDQVDGLNRYPEPQHATLVRHLAKQYGLPEDHVLLTRGSDD
ncbi:MAG: histidinol-phosphate transaminase, partial [Xanthomonadales bacterium]|nr:histidinol-phosphate transaminase [Xanthomonadales bacterium]